MKQIAKKENDVIEKIEEKANKKADNYNLNSNEVYSYLLDLTHDFIIDNFEMENVDGMIAEKMKELRDSNGR